MIAGVVTLLAAGVVVQAGRGAVHETKAALPWVRQHHLTWGHDPAVDGLRAQFEAEVPPGRTIFLDIDGVDDDSVFARQRLSEFAAIDGDPIVATSTQAQLVLSVDGSRLIVDQGGQWSPG